MKKDQGKTSKPAVKGKVKDLPTRKLTAEQERSVKGGYTKPPGGGNDLKGFGGR